MRQNILPIVIFLIFIGCSSKDNTPKDKTEIINDPIENFWSWFNENEKRLRDFETDPDKILEEVLSHTKEIKEGLAIELEPSKDGIIGLTISADGDYNLFPTVIKIIEKAPEIQGWKFYSFRQRGTTEATKSFVLEKDGKKIDVSDMKFYPVINGDSLDIIIHVKELTEENLNQIAYSGLLLVDNIIGEYDCVTQIRHYDFQPMPTDEKELKKLSPLFELADYIDNFKASKTNR